MDVASWCAEVIDLGDIVQDSDGSVSDAERERRFNRYVELVDAMTGEEPDEAFRCLLASVRDQDDHGAHEAVVSALLQFAPHRRARLTASELADTVQRFPDLAGNLLGQLALGSDDVVAALNDAIAALPESQREAILESVVCEEEGDGWLSSYVKRAESVLVSTRSNSPAENPRGYRPDSRPASAARSGWGYRRVPDNRRFRTGKPVGSAPTMTPWTKWKTEPSPNRARG